MTTVGTRGVYAGRALSPSAEREMEDHSLEWFSLPAHLIYSGTPSHHEPIPDNSNLASCSSPRRTLRPQLVPHSNVQQHRKPSAENSSAATTSQRQHRARKPNTLQNCARTKSHPLQRELKALGISYSHEDTRSIKQRLRQTQVKDHSAIISHQSNSRRKNKRGSKRSSTSARVRKQS